MHTCTPSSPHPSSRPYTLTKPHPTHPYIVHGHLDCPCCPVPDPPALLMAPTHHHQSVSPQPSSCFGTCPADTGSPSCPQPTAVPQLSLVLHIVTLNPEPQNLTRPPAHPLIASWLHPLSVSGLQVSGPCNPRASQVLLRVPEDPQASAAAGCGGSRAESCPAWHMRCLHGAPTVHDANMMMWAAGQRAPSAAAQPVGHGVPGRHA